jgi:hypothetical protein
MHRDILPSPSISTRCEAHEVGDSPTEFIDEANDGSSWPTGSRPRPSLLADYPLGPRSDCNNTNDEGENA